MNIDYSLNGYAQCKKIRKAYVLLQNYCAVDHTVFVKIPVYKKIDPNTSGQEVVQEGMQSTLNN